MLVFEPRKPYDAEQKRAFQRRTRTLARNVALWVQRIPESRIGRIYGDQLIRSSASTAGNYRAACRARSRADWLSKMGIVEEECDESMFWLEMHAEVGLCDESSVSALYAEANEILSIVVSSIKTAKERQGRGR